jgi:hypothetical protein
LNRIAHTKCPKKQTKIGKAIKKQTHHHEVRMNQKKEEKKRNKLKCPKQIPKTLMLMPQKRARRCWLLEEAFNEGLLKYGNFFFVLLAESRSWAYTTHPLRTPRTRLSTKNEPSKMRDTKYIHGHELPIASFTYRTCA